MVMQTLRQGRRRPTSMGEPPMLSGMVFCAGCGAKMYLNRNRSTDIIRLICSAYRNETADCTAHYIREDTLRQVILCNLKEAIAYVKGNETDFIREASDTAMWERDHELAKKKDGLAQAERRVSELDVIIKRLYEDNVAGKLTDERFIKLSRGYEREQDEMNFSIEVTRKELKGQEQKRTNVKSFIATAKKYTDLEELDATVLREFIEKVYVSERDKQTGMQPIQIVYNFIGAFDFEAARELSESPRQEVRAGIV